MPMHLSGRSLRLGSIPIVLLLAAIALVAGHPRAADPSLVQVDVFRSGEDDYHTYRIPSLIATRQGTLLAFCEGRRDSSSDTGDIDLLLKRSFDNGKSWTSLAVVADHGGNTIGNPCPVIDRKTGTIWLLSTANPGRTTEKQIVEGTGEGTRTVWVTRSTDDGSTWAPLKEITRGVKLLDWSWYATGPGNGIQLSTGRLVIPCDHIAKGSKVMHSNVIYSDDGGKTWKLGGVAGEKTNECAVVELSDGSLLLNMRSYHGHNRRAIARSLDRGLTWSDVELDETLVEPECQASLVRFTARPLWSRNRLLFSNPADTDRVRMTVRLSYDEGKSWPVSKLLHAGPSAYSSLAILMDQTIGCLYERGEKSSYERITFARFNLEWLTDASDHLSRKEPEVE